MYKCKQSSSELGKQDKYWFDRCITNFIENHENVLSINSTSTRWGLLSVASTVAIGILALAFAIIAIQPILSGMECVVMQFISNVLIWIVAVLLLLIGFTTIVIIAFFAFYFLRHNRTQTDWEVNIDKTLENTKTIKESIIGKPKN